MRKNYLKISITTAFILGLSTAFAQTKTTELLINTDKTYQTIHNFGASDAWACQFVGQWPDEKKNKIADLLFSSDTLANGTPKGIALSMWRFNIGAGSAQQGNKSGIKDEWRRAESFLEDNGKYNWQNQAAQLWFLKAAKQRGVPLFLGFNNSPPIQFTRNNLAFAHNAVTNLPESNYLKFADFLAQTVKGIRKQTGVKLNYISPVNEPQWDWSDGGQEGTPFSNKEIAGLVKSINAVFTRQKIDTKILVAEAGDIQYIFDGLKKHEKGYQAKAFFDSKSENYIGNLPSVSKTIAAHSYFTTSPLHKSVELRQKLATQVSAIPGLSYWQSEYCILGDNDGDIKGEKRDLGIDAALYVAGVIHTDLTVANASAWQWWTAISAYDYKDGLIYIDKNKTDGNYQSSKMLWALGNYSRFVKPGFVRVDAGLPQETEKYLRVSAYKKGKELTLVVINTGKEDARLNINKNTHKITFSRKYTTSDKAELLPSAAIDTNGNLNVGARSVTTFTGTID